MNPMYICGTCVKVYEIPEKKPHEPGEVADGGFPGYYFTRETGKNPEPLFLKKGSGNGTLVDIYVKRNRNAKLQELT